MRFRLLPTDRKFFDLFAEAGGIALTCARRLEELLRTPQDDSATQKVLASKSEMKSVTAAIFERLNTSFVTPFDREDIHALAEEFADLVDDMAAVASRVELMRVTEVAPELFLQSDILVHMCDEAAELMARLESMKGLAPHLEQIDDLESEGDGVFHEALASLFSGDFDALDVVRMKDLVESMEAAMNTVEDISDIVEAIALKHS